MSARVDPATLSQEIDETRADVGETLDALQAKLSPGQLFDQAVSFCSERGYELTRRLGQTIREHPVPTALAGAGILWYLSARRRHDDELYVDEAFVVDGDYEDVEVEDVSPGAGEKLRSAAASLRRRGSGAASTIRERASGAASTIKERASGATSTIKERAGRASGAVRQRAQRAGEGFSHLVYEQPLLLGAVGVAIGAAIAALLPSSETEDQLLGEASDRAFDRAKQKGGEEYEKVRETIKRAAEGAQRATSSDPGSASYPGAS